MSTPSALVRDVAALLAVVVAAVGLAAPTLPWQGGRVIYVSRDGSDMRRGRSLESAVATIQRAAELARPGDTVLIAPGTYRERLRVRRGGRPGAPVVFRAAEPGSVFVSGETDPGVVAQLVWRDEGGGVHSAEVPWPVYRVRAGDHYLFHTLWSNLEGFHNLVDLDGAWDTSIYVSEERRLYIFLADGRTPDTTDLAFHGPIPSPREWGNIRSANVWVEADHVVFEGLRFVAGIGAGLLLWSADHVEVRDCLFEGAGYGIQTRPRVRAITDVTAEYNLYHNYPQAAWRDEWLAWDQVYAHYSSSTLIASLVDGVTVRGNLIAHSGDALRLTSRGGVEGVEIRDNLIFRGTDDAIEFDGPGVDVIMRGNLIYDVHESLGLSPVTQGPVLVEDNLFLHPAGRLNGAQMKLLNPAFDLGDSTSTIRNVEIRHNTFVGNWLSWWSTAPVADVLVEDNLFAVQRMTDPPWHAGVTARGNTFEPQPTGGYPDPALNPRWWDRTAEPAGADGYDGAVAPGRRWSMPRPGPRWFDFSEHPATAPIDSLFAGRLFQ